MSDNSAARLSPEMKKILQVLFLLSVEARHRLAAEDQVKAFGVLPALKWEPAFFIGENPTPSQIGALSRELRRLEQRGLIWRLDKEGKRRVGRAHTVLVALTPMGIATVLELGTTEAELARAREESWQNLLTDEPENLRDIADALDHVKRDGVDISFVEFLQARLEVMARTLELLNPNVNR